MVDFGNYQKEMTNKNKSQDMRIDDIFNRLIANEIYLEKYLPYNTFVQFCEIIHVSLEPK